MRSKLLVANWKMYKTRNETKEFITSLKQLCPDMPCEVVVAPSFTNLGVAMESSLGSKIKIAAQNMHDGDEGAFTGEVSGPMLKELGISYVIVGHSERRLYFKEDSAFIGRKIAKALQLGITPIFCVGESLSDRESGKTEQVVQRQIQESLQGLRKDIASQLVLAYEPVWAIGTGKTATAEMAQQMHVFCRHVLEEIFGVEVSSSMKLLYGGSVKPENIESLLRQKEIDGALVGGASLNVESFSQMIHQCRGII